MKILQNLKLPAISMAFIIGITTVMGVGVTHAGENDKVVVSEGKYRKTIPSRPAAGYFELKNDTENTLVLIAAKTVFAERTELHTHLMKDGVMSMRKLDKIEIPAHSVLEFAPGKHHIMFFGFDDKTAKNNEVPLTLMFEGGFETEVMLKPITQ